MPNREDTRKAEAVTLPIHCAYCHGAVTLQMTDWPIVLNADGSRVQPDHPLLQKAVWRCPYCQRENDGGFPGRLAWVRKGHEPETLV